MNVIGVHYHKSFVSYWELDVWANLMEEVALGWAFIQPFTHCVEYNMFKFILLVTIKNFWAGVWRHLVCALLRFILSSFTDQLENYYSSPGLNRLRLQIVIEKGTKWKLGMLVKSE